MLNLPVVFCIITAPLFSIAIMLAWLAALAMIVAGSITAYVTLLWFLKVTEWISHDTELKYRKPLLDRVFKFIDK